MDDTQKQIAELGEKLARLESLRPDLGDAVTGKTKADLETQLRALIQTGGGAAVSGNVSTQGSDFVGRDKILAALADRSAVIGGSAA